jgi:hypothetical protein
VQLGREAADSSAPARGTATYCRPATLTASHTKKAKNYAPHLIRELDELGDFTIREPEPAMGELLNNGSIRANGAAVKGGERKERSGLVCHEWKPAADAVENNDQDIATRSLKEPSRSPLGTNLLQWCIR